MFQGSYREVSIFFRYGWNFAFLLFNTCTNFQNYRPFKIRENFHWKKNLKEKLNTKFPMLDKNWSRFSVTINEYFLSLQLNFFVRLKAV